MKVVLAIITIYALLWPASSCWPYYLDPELASNRTLLDEFLEQYKSQSPTMGWTHAVGQTSPLTIWPNDPDGIVRINYCFSDGRARNSRQWLEAGFQEWTMRLGSPGPANGHRIGFIKEFTNEAGIPQQCRDDYGNWNQQVPLDTLELIATNEYPNVASASTGYHPVNYNNRIGRHFLRFGDTGVISAVPPNRQRRERIRTLAHEWGHVLGLVHEHQRLDREQYVHFYCKNLARYDEVKQQAEAHGIGMDRVCTDPVLSLQFGFIAMEFSVFPYYDQFIDPQALYPWQRVKSSTYDIDSIMHYSGYTAARPGPFNSVRDCVLSKWNVPRSATDPPKEPDDQDSKIVQLNIVPSLLDITAIRELYPWGGS